MTWREKIENWLVPKEVKKAVKENEKAHAELRKALDGYALQSLKEVDELLRRGKDNVAA